MAPGRSRPGPPASRGCRAPKGMWQNAPDLRCAHNEKSPPVSRRPPMRFRALALALLLVPLAAAALDVNVIGLFPGKAVVVVNRGAPRTLAVGQSTPEGVKLVATDARAAVLEIDGRRVS